MLDEGDIMRRNEDIHFKELVESSLFLPNSFQNKLN
jgi:hypothetical protein